MTGALVLASIALAVGLLLGLLNARDRRRDRSAALVLRACETAASRGLVAVRVRAPLLSRRTVAFVAMPADMAPHAWATVRRLAHILPSDIDVVVEAGLDRRLGVHGPRIGRVREDIGLQARL